MKEQSGVNPKMGGADLRAELEWMLSGQPDSLRGQIKPWEGAN
jgi:hypothetical protein